MYAGALGGSYKTSDLPQWALTVHFVNRRYCCLRFRDHSLSSELLSKSPTKSRRDCQTKGNLLPHFNSGSDAYYMVLFCYFTYFLFYLIYDFLKSPL